MTTFNAGPIKPPTPPPSAFHIHVSDAGYKFRPGTLSHDAFVQLQCDMALPMAVLRELWDGGAGPKSRRLIHVLWSAFRSTPTTAKAVEHLVTHPNATPGIWPARDREALVLALLELLEDTAFPESGSTSALTVRRRVGRLEGRHIAYWLLVPEAD